MLRIRLFRRIHDTIGYLYSIFKVFIFSTYFKAIVVLQMWFSLSWKTRQKIKKTLKRIIVRIFTAPFKFDRTKTYLDRWLERRKIKFFVYKLIIVECYLLLMVNFKKILNYWKFKAHKKIFWNLFFITLFWSFFYKYEFAFILTDSRHFHIYQNELRRIASRVYKPLRNVRLHDEYIFKIIRIRRKTKLTMIQRSYLNQESTYKHLYKTATVCRNPIIKFYILERASGSRSSYIYEQSLLCGVIHKNLIFKLSKIFYYIYIYYYVTGLWVYNEHLKFYLIGLLYKGPDKYVIVDLEDWEDVFWHKKHFELLEFFNRNWFFGVSPRDSVVYSNFDLPFILSNINKNLLNHHNKAKFYWLTYRFRLYRSTKQSDIPDFYKTPLTEREKEDYKKYKLDLEKKRQELIKKNKLKRRLYNFFFSGNRD